MDPTPWSLQETAPLRRLVRALHRILRDGEGDSSLMERFDELTRLLCCKAAEEQRGGPGRPGAASCRADAEAGREAARLRGSLRRLVRENAALFPERFAAFRSSDATLGRMAEALAPVRLSGAALDLQGLAYEEVIRNTFDKGDNQQFFTPRPIVELMVQMLDWPRPGTVCDPACGTGGFLLYVDRFLRQSARTSPKRLLGLEIDERLAWVAGVNLRMHGAGDFEIRCLPGAGSLGSEVRPLFGQIGAIVTNPPFGSDLSDRAILDGFELGRGRPSRRRGVLFVERCLDLLKPGGLLAIVLDDGVLNGPSNADARRLVLERAHARAVVSLPDTAFMPYAAVKASIVLLQKKGGRGRTAGRPRETFFAQARTVGRKPNGEPLVRLDKATGRMELDSDLPEVLRLWQAARSGKTVGGGQQDRAFLARVPDAADGLFAKDGLRLDLAYHHPSRREALRAIGASPYPVRPLAELCEVRNEPLVPCEDLAGEELTYVGLANIEARTGECSPVAASGSSLKSTVRRFVAGDLLFAKMRPELRKVCLVPEGIVRGYASAECIVLVPRRDAATGGPLMQPELLSLLLRSDLVYGQIVHLVIGTGRPRVSQSAVLHVMLPCPPPERQRRLMAEFRRSGAASRALWMESERARAQAEQIASQARAKLAREVLRPGARGVPSSRRGARR